MDIDKQTVGSDQSIVLFPRSYNKRGDDRLHSVQGVTLDGREVNIKLRVDESMLGKDVTPSIAEFSREDVKAKTPCLAAPDNGPGKREGILLFTGCEEDGENRKGILSYIARWAYVLASHSDAPDPVFGIGRVVMVSDSHSARSISAELAELEESKPIGWEALADRKRKALNDPMLFTFYGQLYLSEEEKSISLSSKDEITAFAAEKITTYTKHGVVGGLLLRAADGEGNFIPGFFAEVFPRWLGNQTYQTAEDVMGWFFRSNNQRMTDIGAVFILATPIKRYSCGPSFKNYYFSRKPQESLLKIRKYFLINNEPTLANVAFALSRREESGESFMLKYYPLDAPISTVANLGQKVQEPEPGKPEKDELAIPESTRIRTGLGYPTALSFPAWYQPSLEGPFLLDGEDTAGIVDGTDDLMPDEPQGDPDDQVEGSTQQEELISEAGGEDDGDLSDLFEEISDDELSRIQEAEALEAAAYLAQQLEDEQILAAESAREEAIEGQHTAEVEVEAEPVPTQPEPKVEDNPPPESLRLTDISTDGENEIKGASEPAPIADSPPQAPKANWMEQMMRVKGAKQ